MPNVAAITESPRGGRVSTIGFALLVVGFALTAGVTGATTDSATSGETAALDALEEGTYENQELDAGEIVTYTAELTESDRFVVEAAFDPSVDIGVTVYGPDGSTVGEPLGGAGHHGVEIDGAPADGTYLVVIGNLGDAATFDLSVEHQNITGPNPVPEPLEDGYYENREIGAGETVTYDAALTEGDFFALAAVFDATDDLEVAVYGPDGEPVGEPDDEEDYSYVELSDVSAGGNYTVEVANPTADAVTFDLDVFYEERGPPEPDEVSEPLESGTNRNQELGAGETVTYDVELTEGDFLEVRTAGADGTEVTVTAYGPTGDLAGHPFGGGDYTGIWVDTALENGTYAIEIRNLESEAVTFDLEVEHDELEPDPDAVPEPLQKGTYGQQVLEVGETVTYEAELTADEYFSPQVADPGDDVAVAVYGPDGDPVGESFDGNKYDGVRTSFVESTGTYTVELENRGDESATFDFDVRHFGPDYVPDPLVGGFYGHQVVDAGGTATYDTELSEGDYFQVVEQASPVDELTVAVYGPDGEAVGEPFELDSGNSPGAANHGVRIVEVPENGTYTVEVENVGDEAERFPFHVVREPISVLENGTVAETIGRQEYEFYSIDLGSGGDLSVEIIASNLDNLDVTVLTPEVEELDALEQDGDTGQIELSDVETGGTYLIKMYNAIRDVSEAVDYELDVSHVPADTDDGSEGTSTETNTSGSDAERADDSGVEGADDSTVEGADDSTTERTDDTDSVPGFGPVPAILAFAAATVLAFGRSHGGSR